MKIKNLQSKKFIIMILCVTFWGCVMVGCANGATGATSTTQGTKTETVAAEMFSARDMEIGYDEATCISVTLKDNASTSSSDTVGISGNIITLTQEGTYLFTGALTNGQIVVEAADTAKLQIVLNNVTISNTSTAPIYIKEADKVFVTLANASKNTLGVSGEFASTTTDKVDAAIYSKADLTLNGNGALTINSKYGNGITGKDDLVLTGGVYEIVASGHGLEGKDSVRIAKGEFSLTTGKDGIHSENADDLTLGFVYIAAGTFKIVAEGDGIDGAVYVEVVDGNFDIVTGGGSANAPAKTTDANIHGGGRVPGQVPGQDGTKPGAATNTTNTTKITATNANTNVATTETTGTDTTTVSTKGIKADGKITISKGNFTIDAVDDGIHSNQDILIKGGEFTIATGDDGFHGDGNLTVSDGNINITKSYEGLEGQTIDITGGNINLVASDDGLNAAGGADSSGLNGDRDPFAVEAGAYIKISGGVVKVDAKGDGLDSNGDIYISGGETYVAGPTSGADSALDYNGKGEISGGIFVGTGAKQMAQNFSTTSSQGSILLTTASNQNGDITLKDSSGKTLLTYKATKEYSAVVISAPTIKQNQTYNVTLGDQSQAVEMTSLIYGTTGIGGGMGGGGMGGQRPDKPTGERPAPPPDSSPQPK